MERTLINIQSVYIKIIFLKNFLTKPHHDNYWKEVNDIIKKYSIDIAVILPESELLEWSRTSTNKDLPCKALVPDYKIASEIIDKGKMSKLLIETDLIPKFLTIDRNDINLKDKIKAKLNYPFLDKIINWLIRFRIIFG